MKVVSVINYKGGVGKTTVTANLAAELAANGSRILLVDLDPQTNLTFSFIAPEDWESSYSGSRTIKQSFDSLLRGENFDIRSLVFEPARVKEWLRGRGKLDMICSHLGLINVDLELATLLGGANMRQSKQNFLRVHRRLADSRLSLDDFGYDVVIIDCPPNFNIVTKTAITASQYILVPTRPDFLSTLGIEYLIRNVDGLVRDYNDYAKEGEPPTESIAPAKIGVLFNMVMENKGAPISAQEEYIRRTRRYSGLTVFDSYIKRNDTLFASAPEDGVPVVLRSYSGDSHKSVVTGLKEVAEEFARAIDL